MDTLKHTLEQYQSSIYQIIQDHAAIPYSHKQIRSIVIVSESKNNYLLMCEGWDREQRIHGCVVHVEIVDGKIWIHRDGTEYGIANELVAAGIPNNQIVLAFHPPEIRQYTEFAVN